jgi:BirA family transcriptional regulator, biotin operon repressor / biotin---[acetyl-CoA-carboxylase] ligase
VVVGREALDAGAVNAAVVTRQSIWHVVEVVAETGSTNADVAAMAKAGAAEGLVVVAERQSAGRGRLGRTWESPVGAGLIVSVLLRPRVPTARYGWLPLLAGVAIAAAVSRLTGLDARLKWPNDLLLDGRKCCGILAEADPDGAVVLGFGLNVTLREDELPRADATSLALAGSPVLDRQALLAAILEELADWYTRWQAAGGDPEVSGLRAAYQGICATIGRTVTVSLPGAEPLVGVASGVDGDGRLIVAGRTVAAGDVVHVR